MREHGEPLLLDVQQSYPQLGIRRSKFLELLRLGEIESVKIGSRRLVVASSLSDYVDRLRAESSTGQEQRAGKGIATLDSPTDA